MLNRLLRGRPSHGALCGLLVILHRLLIVPPLFKMHGQFGGNLLHAPVVAHLFAMPNTQMKLLLPTGCHPLVPQLLIEGMVKPIPRREGAVGPAAAAAPVV